MTTTARFNLEIIVGKASVALIEEETAPDAEERAYSLSTDGRSFGTVNLLSYYRPHLAFHLPIVLLWGGFRLYYFDLRTPAIKCRHHDDELRAVYRLPRGWCIVGEISIVTVDDLAERPTSEYHHGEVIMESWWVGETLWVEDFEKRRFSFEFKESGFSRAPEDH
ncbi:MAG: hypothetical protein M3O15_12630 [Acidobacteriota bacterium]|nr:hypothetical protein [Acidobacteriota bacterium]